MNSKVHARKRNMQEQLRGLLSELFGEYYELRDRLREINKELDAVGRLIDHGIEESDAVFFTYHGRQVTGEVYRVDGPNIYIDPGSDQGLDRMTVRRKFWDVTSLE